MPGNKYKIFCYIYQIIFKNNIMGIFYFIFSLLISSPIGGNQNQLNRQNNSTAKVVNVGNTIVDDLNGLIR
jgi:hypothetical protein